MAYHLQQFGIHATALNYTATSFYSGFICQICNPDVFSYFQESNTRKRTKENTIIYSFKSFLTAAEVLVSILDTYIMGFPVWQTFSELATISGEKYDAPQGSVEELIAIKEELKSWPKFFTKADDIYSGKRKVDIIENFNFYRQLSMFSRVSTVFVDINDFLSKHLGSEKYKLLNPEGKGKDTEFILFNHGQELDFDKFGIQFEDVGFSMVDSKYKESLWFLSTTKLSFGLGFLLFFFHK